jgi:hypothetical protein
MKSQGDKIMYDPRMPVGHFVPYERQRMGYFLKVYYGFGATDAIANDSFQLKTSLYKIRIYLRDYLKFIFSQRSEHWSAIVVNYLCEIQKLVGFTVHYNKNLARKWMKPLIALFKHQG